MLKDKSESVKVVVRCRPLGSKEMEEQRECIVNVDMNACFIQVYLTEYYINIGFYQTHNSPFNSHSIAGVAR